jgi:CheY-like chemotaxis protein
MTPSDAALLVVDDNEDNRYTLTRRLKRLGYQNLDTANDGRQALGILRAKKFDLVLLDIMMPEMNGYEVLEHMQADAELRHLPVIMISAVGEMESVVRCIELGAEDYLPKPFDATLLRARVGASLEKKRLRDEVREWGKTLEQRVMEQGRTTRSARPPQRFLLAAVGRVDHQRRRRGLAQDPPPRGGRGVPRPSRIHRFHRHRRA